MIIIINNYQAASANASSGLGSRRMDNTNGILRSRDCSDWGARLDASQPLHGVEPVLEQVRKGVSDLGEFNERRSYFTYFEFVFCMGFEWFIFVPSHVSFDHLLSFITVMFYKLRIPRQSDEAKHFHNFRGAASHKRTTTTSASKPAT